MKLLDRHVTSQYCEALLVATFLVGGVFLGTSEYRKVMYWICSVGLDWQKAFLVSFLQMPSICVFALPAGTLVATILVLYRLNCDGELLAMRMAGVSHFRLMMPFFALSMGAALLSFTINEYVSPQAMSASAKLLKVAGVYCKLPVTKTSIAITQSVKDKDGNAKESRMMMIGRSIDSALKNVTIFDLVDNQVNLIHWAENGRWYRGQWQLAAGRTYSIKDKGKDSEPATASTSSFSSMVIDTIASKVAAWETDGPIPEHKNIAELRALIEQFKADHKPVPVDVLIDFYYRYAQPIACCLLAIAAYPIAVGNHRRGHTSGMIYGGMVTTAYFLIQEITRAMGYQGRMEPCLAVWLPSVTLMLVGLTFLTVKVVWQRD